LGLIWLHQKTDSVFPEKFKIAEIIYGRIRKGSHKEHHLHMVTQGLHGLVWSACIKVSQIA